ncbi:MAG: UDP-N-acetylmuramoyl-tripeptide--D-alanyl-D-alanine ligase, partial [Clostridia bacterium]|nr:UDP-N-acetylmuramoyl-tripeptide--D-alanyl-D-alanine ligase [Clostridia bacterium]
NKAYEAGAACVLAECIPEGIIPLGAGGLVVENSVKALGDIAKFRKDCVSPYTVGVTGSTGKTTTKEFIYSVLSAQAKTHKTEGNFNNDIGMPLTMLKIENGCRYLVLEMGMSGPGEIEYLSRLARPDMAVITNIGDSHIEHFGSREGIRDAKMEIVAGLREGGKVILNGDEPLLSGVDGGIYVSMKDANADYYVSDVADHGMCTTFHVTHGGTTVKDLSIPVLGEHNVFDAALAYAVGAELGMTEEKLREGLNNFKNTGMRQNIYVSSDVTVIEDCYNAAPASMSASLSVLSMIAKREGGRSIAVLGDMRELGDFSRSLHQEVGGKVAELGIDRLYTFGEEAAYIAEGAAQAGMRAEDISVFRDLDDPEALARVLRDDVRATDAILFKASRAVALERVIDAMKG